MSPFAELLEGGRGETKGKQNREALALELKSHLDIPPIEPRIYPSFVGVVKEAQLVGWTNKLDANQRERPLRSPFYMQYASTAVARRPQLDQPAHGSSPWGYGEEAPDGIVFGSREPCWDVTLDERLCAFLPRSLSMYYTPNLVQSGLISDWRLPRSALRCKHAGYASRSMAPIT